ncbi:MAG: hypothetical protein C5S49_08105 [Candidatus Methanogaster sp.]|nr:MAG: hypothetical protein C5S49_08105 [ANME-2 cluster archaeon]
MVGIVGIGKSFIRYHRLSTVCNCRIHVIQCALLKFKCLFTSVAKTPKITERGILRPPHKMTAPCSLHHFMHPHSDSGKHCNHEESDHRKELRALRWGTYNIRHPEFFRQFVHERELKRRRDGENLEQRSFFGNVVSIVGILWSWTYFTCRRGELSGRGGRKVRISLDF